MDNRSTTLPIIDMSGLRSGVAGEREAVGRALNEACLDMGFFYLTGTGRFRFFDLAMTWRWKPTRGAECRLTAAFET